MSTVPTYIGTLYFGGQPIGTGFVITTKGLVVTAYHVLAAISPIPSEASISFKFLHNGQAIPCTVTKYLYPACDVGILQLKSPTENTACLIASRDL